ncbi:MAG: hypothetical protein K2X44_09780 [Magnetospirillum sp.]|nr:hypothetical protein [Magnetospirillum sp.]
MSSAKEIEIALLYLQSECYKAGFPETGYLVEVARLSLEDAKRVNRPEPAPKSNVVRLRA